MRADETHTFQSPGSTSSSLLERIKVRDPDAWNRFSKLYSPLVYQWARQAGVQSSDAADVVQEVFRAVATHIADFRRDRPGDSFRGWLWTITHNKLRDHFRRLATRPKAAGGTDAQQWLKQVPEGSPDESSDESLTTGTGLTRRAVELVQAEFEDRTWQAFWKATVEGQKASEIGHDLGMSVAAVYMAKSRVIRRLREELSGLAE